MTYRVKATLPTLGTVAVDFHKESKVVTEFMGEREWTRLRSVPHLGVAASVFTGVHHSRLEYVLLQCAVTGLIAKLHRNDEQFALSNEVTVAGLSSAISSGEELLKIWILLSNFGHAQYTYGVEKSLLQQATDNPEIREWLVNAAQPRDLRRWAEDVIAGYQYSDFRYLLTLLRISQLPPMDRRKNLLRHYLRNLLLPVAQLFPASPVARYKLFRLRELFYRIRLLSMVALDAHYSHHPISINLNSTIIGLADLLPSGNRQSGFDQLLRGAAGWLADELYLHPSAVSAQKEYEIRFSIRFPRRFKSACAEHRFPQLVDELMTQGLGPPKPHVLAHLVRLTFSEPRRQLLGSSTHYEAVKQLGRDLVENPHSYVSIDFNAYSQAAHVDIFYRKNASNIKIITSIYLRLQRWLLRSLEADTLARIRRIYSRLSKDEMQSAKERDLRRQIERNSALIYSIFDSVIRTFLPENKKGVVLEYSPNRRMSTPVLVRMTLSDGSILDTVTPHLRRVLNENPDAHPPERLQEIRCLQHVFEQAQGKLIMVCPEKFIIKDEHGRHVDDWDGIQIAISDERLALTIVEGKTGGTSHQREEAAFQQLDKTRRMLLARHPLRYRRYRIAARGAFIELFSDVLP